MHGVITGNSTHDRVAALTERSDRTAATLIGALFIVGTVSGVLGAALAGPILSGPDVLARVEANRPQVVLGTLLILTMAFALAMVPVVFYPVAKRYNQVLAMGYVVFRGAAETVVYIVGSLGWLLLVAMSREPGAGAAPVAGWVQLAVGVLWNQVGVLPFGLGALMFSWLLYRSGLVPRWLSLWGLVGAVLYIVPALSAMFGVSLGILMAPLAVQEMVLAVWLVVRGFSRTPDDVRNDGAVAMPGPSLAGGRS